MVIPLHDGAYRAPVQPAAPPPVTPPGEPRSVQVQAEQGDTLASVGRRLGISSGRMAEANPDVPGSDEPLYAGQAVEVPVDHADGDAAAAHEVQPGESLQDIATARGVARDQLAEANGLSGGAEPAPGDTLLVPSASALTDAETDALASLAGVPPTQTLSTDDARALIGEMEALRTGSASERLDALGALAGRFSADEVRTLLAESGVSDAALDRIAGSGEALGALADVVAADTSPADRAAAALALLDAAGDVLGDSAGTFFDDHLSQLPNARGVLGGIDTLLDPDASAADGAEASLSIVQSLQSGLGEQFPQLGHRLRALESITGSLGAAVTLLDPDASLQDKAQAAAQLYANVPGVAGDVDRIRSLLSAGGVPDAEAIAGRVAQLPGGDLIPEALRGQLSPELVDSLTPQQAQRIADLAARSDDVAGALGPALTGLTRGAALDSVLDGLSGRSDEAVVATLDALGQLGPGVADDLVTQTVGGRPATEVLAEFIDGLPADARGSIGPLLRDFDAATAARVLDIADRAGPDAAADLLRGLDGANVDSRQVGRMLNDALNLLDRIGVEITTEVAQSLLRNAGKLIPIAGAVPAGYDTYRFAQIAADGDLPPELRYLALQGSKANALDAGLSIAEAFGVTIPFTTAGSALIGVGSLVLDVVIEQQTNAYNADPDGWVAPGYVDAAIAGTLLAGPQAFVELALMFGPEGAVRKSEQLINGSVDLGADGVARLGELQAQAFGDGLSLTADGLHLLADIVRDPSLVGDAAGAVAQEAVRQLSAVADGVGELAGIAREQLGHLVDDLAALGAQGLETLGWIASHPGEAAAIAADALAGLAEQGLALASDAGRALAEGAMSALESAHGALLAAGDVARETLDAVGERIDQTLDAALALGERGLEFVGWAASNPGEAAALAREKLVDVVSEAGDLAIAAYDQLSALGEEAAALADVAIARLADAGAVAVDTLVYIAENPVASAGAVRDAAIEGLGRIADGVGAAAERATDAVVGFVDQGIASAQSVVGNLLAEGGDAADRIVRAWGSELSQGAQEVVAGLADLGDAGAEALGRLADGGIGFAGDVLGGLRDGLGSAWRNTGGRIFG